MMGYAPGFEGPHPSKLPARRPDEQSESCGHTGYLDNWPGDEITPPGRVWSCGQACGAEGSQVFYPDEEA